MSKPIFINGRFLTQPVTGVQRYSLEVVRHMDLILGKRPSFQDVKLICLAPPEEFSMPNWKNIPVHRVGVNKGNIWEQIDLPFFAKGHSIFSPANIGPWYYRNQAITFHDAGVFAMPAAYSSAFRAKYIFVYKQLARKARSIFTDSNFSREELSRYLGIPPGRFTVIPLGSDHLDHIRPDGGILTQQHLEKNSYLLTVASQSRHKNLHNVLGALNTVGTEIQIVAVGGSFRKIFQEHGMQQPSANIQSLGYVSDQELKALYENALGFIFPSTYEGFGLPVVEAMRCGCPVMCSNAASLPEVAGDAALYFDPYRVDHIAETIGQFLSNAQLREQLRINGYKHSSKFEWSKTARQTLYNLMQVR